MNKILDLLQAMSNEDLQQMTSRGFYHSLPDKEEYFERDVMELFWEEKYKRLSEKHKVEALPII